MKKSKSPKRKLTMRLLMELQVREYIERYHPDMGDVVINIKPGRGCSFASARKVHDENR